MSLANGQAASASGSASGSVTGGGPVTRPGDARVDSPTGRYRNGVLTMDGRLLTSVGRITRLGDFPEGIAVSRDGRWAVVSNAGQGEGAPGQGNESLQLVNVATGAVTDTVTDHLAGQDSFYNGGVAWNATGTRVYATGGGNDAVYRYARVGDRLVLLARWVSVRETAPTAGGGALGGGVPSSAPVSGDSTGYSKGVALTPDGKTVLVTNEQGGSITALNAVTGAIKWQTPLGTPASGGAYPAGIAVSPDGTTAYVAAQGTNTLDAVNTITGAITDTVPVGDHPVSVTVSPSGKQAFVTNANDDSISIVDLTGTPARQVAQVSTHLRRGEVNGASPVAASYDPLRHRLYVANAGENTVAVFGGRAAGRDLVPATVHQLGQIPTALYPSAVAVTRMGTVLAVSAKGYGGVPVTTRQQYDGNDMVGTLARLAAPKATTLASMTRRASADQVYTYARAERLRPANSPIPTWSNAGRSPIKHVVLVVRENRTFDQEFGDLRSLGYPGARVDPSYLEFGLNDAKGRTVTPNAHAIATRFGVSDNFFSNGDASIQGHDWTSAGVSTYYTESSWTQYYSNRNHPYDPVSPIVYPRCGALFQQFAARGITFRNFGELVGAATAQTPTVQAAPGAACPTPGGAFDAASAANASPTYPDNLTLTTVKDTDRLSDFKAEYAPLVAANTVPAFSYVLMGNDHTDGTTPGKPTPQALVATNDQAVGGLVDYLSHTPQWKSTAVFIEEDDSQDGLDHVDGHRNIFLAASPYIRPGTLSHIHISQASVTAMIDRILGIAPSTSYAQYAAIPYDVFTATPDTAPYRQRIPTYPLTATNGPTSAGTAASVPIDTSGVDLAGPVLEAQLWQATHPRSPMPHTLLSELAARGGIVARARQAWARGAAYRGNPLRTGLTVAPGYGDSNGQSPVVAGH